MEAGPEVLLDNTSGLLYADSSRTYVQNQRPPPQLSSYSLLERVAFL